MIQLCRLRYRFLYPLLPQNRGKIQTLQRILISVATMLCFCPLTGSLNPYILRFQFVKIPQFVILLGYSLFYWVFRYTTEMVPKNWIFHWNVIFFQKKRYITIDRLTHFAIILRFDFVKWSVGEIIKRSALQYVPLWICNEGPGRTS